ncbi:MAG TPA: hypothetical protein VKS60_19980 [Stellaceae bacterium]|nr:hypothetical protein [Stellaceae bacterium]
MEVRALRTILLNVPPLLADLIRRAASVRLQQSDVSLTIALEIADDRGIAERLQTAAPDLVIVGQVDAEHLPPGLAPVPVPVLALSTDMTRLLGPKPDDVAELTPASLAAALLAIAQTRDPTS